MHCKIKGIVFNNFTVEERAFNSIEDPLKKPASLSLLFMFCSPHISIRIVMFQLPFKTHPSETETATNSDPVNMP